MDDWSLNLVWIKIRKIIKLTRFRAKQYNHFVAILKKMICFGIEKSSDWDDLFLFENALFLTWINKDLFIPSVSK